MKFNTAVMLRRAFVFGGRGGVAAPGLQIPLLPYLSDSLNIGIWRNGACDTIDCEERLRTAMCLLTVVAKVLSVCFSCFCFTN